MDYVIAPGVLVDYQIIGALMNGELKIHGFDLKNAEDLKRIQPSSLDIRIAALGHPDGRKIEPEVRSYVDHDGKEITERGWWLSPGVLYLGASVERFELRENYKIQLHGKSSIGRLGAVVHLTAGLMDPGFVGDLVFEISNLMLNNDDSGYDIWFSEGQAICQVEIMKLNNSASAPYGAARGSHYAGQDGLRPSRHWNTHTRARRTP